jgi:hypothetical protein
MRDKNDGGGIIDTSARLMSRAVGSQSASLTSRTLARAAVLPVLRVNTVFIVNYVNIAVT